LIISCDIQDTYSLEDEYRLDFINYADILFFSAVNFTEPLKILKEFGKRYPQKSIICGMGNRGCAAYHNGEIVKQDALSGLNPITDTNGAGDALAMGFITAFMIEKLSLEKSLKKAQILARDICSLKNPKSSFLSNES